MRQWINLFEDQNGFVYHATHVSNLESIKQNGLVPQEPSDNWPEYDRDDYSDEDDDEDDDDLPPEAFEARTFVFDNFDEAKGYAENYGENAAILRIVKNNFHWDEGSTDYSYEYTTEIIPPNFISIFLNGKWIPLK